MKSCQAMSKETTRNPASAGACVSLPRASDLELSQNLTIPGFPSRTMSFFFFLRSHSSLHSGVFKLHVLYPPGRQWKAPKQTRTNRENTVHDRFIRPRLHKCCSLFLYTSHSQGRKPEHCCYYSARSALCSPCCFNFLFFLRTQIYVSFLQGLTVSHDTTACATSSELAGRSGEIYFR